MLLEKRKVTVELITEMLGTVPSSKAIYAEFIESKRPEDQQEQVEADTVVEKAEARGWTGFHEDDNGLFVYDYFIKGMIKNAGNVLKDHPAIKVKNLRSKLTDYCFVFPRKVYLGKDNADGVLERPLRAQTAQGPRVTLARSDSVEAGTQFSFEVGILPNRELSWKLLETLLSYGELQGLGQFRNGGYGRFKVISIEGGTDIPDVICEEEAQEEQQEEAPQAAPKRRGRPPKGA